MAKEDERLPERKVERTEGESAFQRVGPIEANQTRLSQSCSATWN